MDLQLIKAFFRKNRLILLLLLAALIFRVILLPTGFHIDLIINSSWGEWIYLNGAKGFYQGYSSAYSSPTQFPLISLIYTLNFTIYARLLLIFTFIGDFLAKHNVLPFIFKYWFDFVNWFGWTLYGETPFSFGYLVSMEAFPVMADILIGLIIFMIGKKRVGTKKALVISGLFLFLPFSWYTSAVWGQYDQLSTLLVLVSFLLLYRRKGFLFPVSVVLFGFAIQVKPTAMFLAPFYLFYFFYQKPSFVNLISSFIAGAVSSLLTLYPFTSWKFADYTTRFIYPKIFNSDRYALVNRAFNLWDFLKPIGGWSTTYKILGVNALTWGTAITILFTLLAFKVFLKNKNLKGLFIGLYLTSAASYLFATGMVDRYFFSAVVFLGILVFFYPKLLRYWLLTALLFSFNLFYSWGYPLMKPLEAWRNFFIIRGLSLAQVLLFIVILRVILNRKVI